MDTATGGGEALFLISERGPYAVVIAGMDMPGMTGVELFSHLAEKMPETVRIMVTGNSGQQTAIEAVNKGHVFQFLTKPCDPALLVSSVKAAMKQYELVTAERELLESTLSGSVKVLTDIISMVEPDSFGDAQKVREYSQKVAQHLGLTDLWELELAAMLAPIGYVAVPPALVKKARSDRADTITGPERDMLNRVPQIGSDLLSQIPRLKKVAKIIRYQKKNLDGSGFPVDSVSRHDIPIGSRILRAVTDLVEIENKGMPTFKAIEVLRRWPNLYDPDIVEAIAKCLVKDSGGLQGGVAVNELRVGQILVSDVVSKDKVLIVSAGNKISKIILEKVRNFAELGGVEEPIFVKEADEEPPPDFKGRPRPAARA